MLGTLGLDPRALGEAGSDPRAGLRGAHGVALLPWLRGGPLYDPILLGEIPS